MKIKVTPHQLSKSIFAPPSKSYLQRAIAMACFSDETYKILGYESSNDVDAAIGVARNLGKQVIIKGNHLIISGKIDVAKKLTVNMGESGLCTRMFSPLLALIAHQPITIMGEGSLLKRPMSRVVELLTLLGCDVTSSNGFLPIIIHSKATVNEQLIEMDSSDSSQLLTGLLMAISVSNEKSYPRIKVTNLVSKPYIDITIEVVEQFGIKIHNEEYRKFTFQKITNTISSTITSEGDWSGAAFLLVAGAIAGKVSVFGLNLHSLQSDRAILSVLEQCGAQLNKNDEFIASGKGNLQAFHFDASDCPDLFPPLAALASQCQGKSIIVGVNRLIHKESDRANTIKTVLNQLGIEVVLEDNEMHILGGKIDGATVSSHNDHRIAMMATVMGLVASSSVTIEDAEAINKSYPKFYEDLGVLS
jgi:3-phosphoshikimate 1-carboxyvinyltransferase